MIMHYDTQCFASLSKFQVKNEFKLKVMCEMPLHARVTSESVCKSSVRLDHKTGKAECKALTCQKHDRTCLMVFEESFLFKT